MPHHPGLLLHVPGDWDADPVALAELRRDLSDKSSATLILRPSSRRRPIAVWLYSGAWPAGVDDRVRPLVDAAFFTLEWVNVEDVS